MGVQAMAPRVVFAALIFAFSVAVVFATLTTLHQVSTHTTTGVRSAARS
jgi:hypothetical protein